MHSAAVPVAKCLDAHGKVTYTQGTCPPEMHRAGEVAPPPPPGEGSSEPRRDWAKVLEHKPGPEDERHKGRGQTRTERKHATKCVSLERKLAKLEDRRLQQGRQGYTLKDREKLEQEIRELEGDLARDGCR
jgi:hypothetical protein